MTRIMERGNEVHVRFWGAVSGFAGASRLSVGRQKAVIEVERIVGQIEAAARADERTKVLGAVAAVPVRYIDNGPHGDFPFINPSELRGLIDKLLEAAEGGG